MPLMEMRMDGYASLSDPLALNFSLRGRPAFRFTGHEDMRMREAGISAPRALVGMPSQRAEAARVDIGPKKYSCVDGNSVRPRSTGSDVLLAGYVGPRADGKQRTPYRPIQFVELDNFLLFFLDKCKDMYIIFHPESKEEQHTTP